MFSPKRPNEIESFGFDYVDIMAPGETIVEVLSVTVTVLRGVDPDVDNMVLGSASFSGTSVSFMLRNGVEGVIYCVACLVRTSNAQHLELESDLLVTHAC